MSELYQEATDLYIEENYYEAVKIYDQLVNALAVEPKTLADYHYKRALCYIKLSDSENALADVTKAVGILSKINSSTSKKVLGRYCFTKGSLELEQKKHTLAYESLKKAKENEFKENTLDAKLGEAKAEVDRLELEKKKKEAEELAQKKEAADALIPAKIRHEWYQTDEYVYVSVMVRNVKPENVTVEFLPKEFTLSIKQETGSTFEFNIDPLLQEIDPNSSSYSVLKPKIEFKLKKSKVGIKWTTLEGSDDVATASKPSYPSSSKVAKNWDAVEREAEKELKNEPGDINSVFQTIFKDADDDTRRAMMKSYTESKGTALSTDWKDVGSKKMEVSPPDCFDYKEPEY